jgi:nucleoside-diphosphate-sugar epimerase
VTDGSDGTNGTGALVLVTGATGFIGSHTAAAFAEAGYRLRCTVRASSDTRPIEALQPELVELDLALAADYRRAVRGVDVVVHVGGLTRARSESEYERVNADATERLAAAAAAEGVQRFVLVSSLAARGPDGSDGPVSDYGRSKREAERRLRDVMSGSGTVVLRPAGVYGPRDTDLLPLFRMAKWGLLIAPAGGGFLQPVYVDDVAAAAVRATETAPGFGPFPIAEPDRYTWSEVARVLGSALGKKVRLIPLPGTVFEGGGLLSEVAARALGRVPELDRRRAEDLARYSWTCDVTATEKALGWTARVPLADGLGRTARWYREHRWL